MSEWEVYYGNRTEAVGFRYSRLHYAYVIDQFAKFIAWQREGKRSVAVLGGINPNATKPEEFESLIKAGLGEVETVIVDQNREALRDIPSSSSKGILARLENLPDEIDEVSLMICDFTLDFMNDDQVTRFRKSLPKHLFKNGLLIVAIDNPLSTLLNEEHYRNQYGVEVYNRAPDELVNIMPDLKCIYQAETDKNTFILVFAKNDSRLPKFIGSPVTISEQSPAYREWLEKNYKRYL